MSRTRARDWILLALISIVTFLVLGELAIRAYLTRRTFYDVEMSRYARSLKIDAENPLIGHLHRPNREVKLMNATVRINSDGFRDDEYPVEKGQRWRIIFMGDSPTFGWGVEKEQRFEHLLEREIDAGEPTEIINFEAGNYNTVQEVNLLLEKGLRCRPDQVELLPELHELVGYTFTREYPLVADFLRANGIPVFDLAPSFANETDPA